ncbi:DUF2705 family protein [Terrilactibacillus laevilacticus]|uniref:DUF2705 family protein n=1 Tax=Terrilactibacillus laevilacticus TaxID=1380157 RepID=UPI001147714D|nr:DUF2705 family protein [Terrilactibacillus laevilacticus]
MIKRKKLFIFVIATVIIQVLYMQPLNFSNVTFPFLDGVPMNTSYQLQNRFLLNWYVPLVSISFYFSGLLKDELIEYGPMIITRNTSRIGWVLKKYVYMLLILVVFLICQLAIFYFYSHLNHQLNIHKHIYKALLIYYVTLVLLYSLQIFLEMFINPRLSLIIMNVYIVFSILIVVTLENLHFPMFLNYLFFPNYLMGFRNGLSDITQFNHVIIHFSLGLWTVIIINMIVFILLILRITKIELL